MDNSTISETRDTDWKTLYRIGAYAILIAVIFFRRYYGVELMTFKGFGIFDVLVSAPVRAQDWFGLFRDLPYAALSILGLLRPG